MDLLEIAWESKDDFLEYLKSFGLNVLEAKMLDQWIVWDGKSVRGKSARYSDYGESYVHVFHISLNVINHIAKHIVWILKKEARFKLKS